MKYRPEAFILDFIAAKTASSFAMVLNPISPIGSAVCAMELQININTPARIPPITTFFVISFSWKDLLARCFASDWNTNKALEKEEFSLRLRNAQLLKALVLQQHRDHLRRATIACRLRLGRQNVGEKMETM